MTAERDSKPVEVSQADGDEYIRLNRARMLICQVCEACELDWDDAMNILANIVVSIAVQQCRPRDEVVQAIGAMYDLRLKRDMKDETLN